VEDNPKKTHAHTKCTQLESGDHVPDMCIVFFKIGFFQGPKVLYFCPSMSEYKETITRYHVHSSATEIF
jgi:ribosomal protein S17